MSANANHTETAADLIHETLMAWTMPASEPVDDPQADKTVDYYYAKGWEYAALIANRIVLVRWDDEIRLMVTDCNGNIHSEARFDETRLGSLMLDATLGALHEALA